MKRFFLIVSCVFCFLLVSGCVAYTDKNPRLPNITDDELAKPPRIRDNLAL